MRLYTEAFSASAPPLIIVIGVIAALCSLFCMASSESLGAKAFWLGLLTFNLTMLIINSVGYGVDSDQLSADLKDQLGIEKVSYDDNYRQLTGEKDDKVVSCFLAEEGTRGDIYEVICK